MTTPQMDSIPAIIVTARKTLGLNQAAFGKVIGRGQSLVSKYEHGQVDPPGHVVIRCVNILSGGLPKGEEISAVAVARLVESRLEDDRFSKLRAALAELIESLPVPHPRNSAMAPDRLPHQ